MEVVEVDGEVDVPPGAEVPNVGDEGMATDSGDVTMGGEDLVERKGVQSEGMEMRELVAGSRSMGRIVPGEESARDKNEITGAHTPAFLFLGRFSS